MYRSFCLLVLLAVPAAAQTPMSAQAFEDYTTGKTLFYVQQGTPYGAERYLPGRHVVWSFLDGDCQKGRWFPSADRICFVYEDRPGAPQCWTFYTDGARLSARFENDPTAGELIEVEQSSEPLDCPTPYLGVRASE